MASLEDDEVTGLRSTCRTCRSGARTRRPNGEIVAPGRRRGTGSGLAASTARSHLEGSAAAVPRRRRASARERARQPGPACPLAGDARRAVAGRDQKRSSTRWPPSPRVQKPTRRGARAARPNCCSATHRLRRRWRGRRKFAGDRPRPAARRAGRTGGGAGDGRPGDRTHTSRPCSRAARLARPGKAPTHPGPVVVPPGARGAGRSACRRTACRSARAAAAPGRTRSATGAARQLPRNVPHHRAIIRTWAAAG